MADRLATMIRLHQGFYRADVTSITRMVARYPPVTKTRDGEAEGEPADAIGMNLSARLIRYLGHPEGYGEAFPWRSALWALRGKCRKEHRYHRQRWQGSLCESAVRLVVMNELTIREAARTLEYSYLVPVLRDGFEFIEEHMYARQRAANLDRKDVEEPARVGHPLLPGLHARECPSCRRGLASGAIMAPAS